MNHCGPIERKQDFSSGKINRVSHLVVVAGALDVVRPESVPDVAARAREVRLVRERVPGQRVDIAGEADLVAVIAETAPARPDRKKITKAQHDSSKLDCSTEKRSDFVWFCGSVLQHNATCLLPPPDVSRRPNLIGPNRRIDQAAGAPAA